MDTKFDFLVTDICDKISTTIDLLLKDGYFKELDGNKRQIYNKYLHPKNINLKDKKIWDALGSGEVLDVFQFNTPIGIETAKVIKPQNPAEMTAANALLRLTAPEGQDRPFDRYVKFRKNLDLWYKEMSDFGLTKEEQKILEPYYLRDFGVPHSQEQLMLMVMDKNISGFTLEESNTTRKVLAKKQVKKIPEVKEKFLAQCPSKTLGDYAWATMMLPQMSYSFSEVHSLLYSFIGIQTLFLATKFKRVYWNCSCLIVNSQSIEEDQDEDELFASNESYFNELPELNEDEEEKVVDSYEEEEDCDGYPCEVYVLENGLKKKKVKSVSYGKMASAIGKMKQANISVSPPDINKSSYTFSPDAENDIIKYGLSGITGIGADIVKEIMKNRPYSSLEDLLAKVKLKKPQVVNLIKSGALEEFLSRQDLMQEYIYSICGAKKRLTLQNVGQLIEKNLFKEEHEFNIRVFKYNKYLRKLKTNDVIYFDEPAFKFYESFFDIDKIKFIDGCPTMPAAAWKKIYDSYMDPLRTYIKENQAELLEKLNKELFDEMWNKYASGTIEKWSMDSVNFYQGKHELDYANLDNYGIVNFFDLPEEPMIANSFYTKKDHRKINMFTISKIAGTVIDKDKTRNSITLLTKEGVVTVKAYGIFPAYDKQISVRGEDGKKKVLEKSWFSRGNKVIVQGFRRGDMFVAKKYKNTPGHHFYLIKSIDENGDLEIQEQRVEVE